MPKTKTKKPTSRLMKKAAPRFSARLGEITFMETGSRHKDGSPKSASEARLKVGSPMSRLEARIPSPVYEMLEHAAALRGLTLTAYVTATMGEDARRTIEQTDIIRLSRADQIAFAEALIEPPAPNAKLLAAKHRHTALIGK
jgi:uncharacterized protein (DUF1778 family)